MPKQCAALTKCFSPERECCSGRLNGKDPDVLSGFSRAHDVVQVIEESITNAVRTANATIIRISWERTGSLNLCVEVKDNGHVDHIGASGLGTQWLDEIAFGRWSRETIDGQTTLVVNFSE